MKIKMIPLGEFIDTLIGIYNSGADFIDLIGDPSETQDRLGILVKEEYVNLNRTEEESYIFGYEEEPDQKEADIKMLTDEDLNQLLNDDE